MNGHRAPLSSCAGEMAVQKDALHRNTERMVRAIRKLHKAVLWEGGGRYRCCMPGRGIGILLDTPYCYCFLKE